MPGFLDRLARRERIAGRVAVVVAHPDDEVLAAGSRLRTMDSLLVIHLTDGSPRDGLDAGRLGLSREDYAALRRQEVQSAMEALKAHPTLVCYGHPDQESILHAPVILDRLTQDLRGVEAIITHAYEHGHPDHDTAALCVHLARRRLGGPDAFEFPIYAMVDGAPAFGRFLPDPTAPETVLPMTDEERARRDAALAAYASQSGVLAFAGEWDERLRPAPQRDFRRAAPNGAAWYDRHGWVMTLALWRERANALLDREGL